jgi:ribonuclease P protein subunit POP4
MITPSNLVRHELTGLAVKVADSKNPANKGLEGKVISETRNTIIIETRKGEKTLFKDQCTFVFELPGGEKVRVDGELLVARPEDRVKKKGKGP